MYVTLSCNSGAVGDSKKINGLTYVKQKNGRWLLERNKALRKILIDLYFDQRKTLRSIHTETGIPHSTLQGALNEFGIMRKKKAVPDDEAQAFCIKNAKTLEAMYDKGLTLHDIAMSITKKTGLPFKSVMVRRYFKSSGKPIRTHAEAIKKASSLGRRRKTSEGEGLFSATSIDAWNYHLDTKLSGLTFTQYKRIVHRFTYMVVSRYPQLFPINAHRRHRGDCELELDHQFSKFSGFWTYNGTDYVAREEVVPLDIMCHPCNLKLIPALTNNRKNTANHIELDELKKAITKFEKQHGKIFEDYYEKYTRDQLIASHTANAVNRK